MTQGQKNWINNMPVQIIDYRDFRVEVRQEEENSPYYTALAYFCGTFILGAFAAGKDAVIKKMALKIDNLKKS